MTILETIGDQIFRIPESQFVSLVRDVESRRRVSTRRERADLVLTKLRPRLIIVRPPRWVTLQRLFCRPFEDVLYTPGSPRKAVGKVPRAAIAPCWEVFTESADAERLRQLEERLAKIELGDEVELSQIGAELWRLGGTTLRLILGRATSSPAQKAELIKRLGNETAFASLHEMAGMLEIAEAIMTLRRSLTPPPMDVVTNSDLQAIIKAFMAATKKGPNYQEFVVYVVLARLRDLSMITDILQRVSDEGAGASISMVSQAAAEAMVSQVEDRMRGFEETMAAKVDKRGLAREAEGLAKSLNGATRSVGSAGSRQQTRRIDHVRSELGQIVRRTIIENEETDIAKSIEAFLEGPEQTDDAAERVQVTDALVELMQDRIVSLRVTERFADELGLARDLNRKLGAIEHGLEGRAKELLRSISRDGFTDPVGMESSLVGTVRLMELALGPDKADKLRQDGNRLLRGEDQEY